MAGRFDRLGKGLDGDLGGDFWTNDRFETSAKRLKNSPEGRVEARLAFSREPFREGRAYGPILLD
jgi:hypothetical protein